MIIFFVTFSMVAPAPLSLCSCGRSFRTACFLSVLPDQVMCWGPPMSFSQGSAWSIEGCVLSPNLSESSWLLISMCFLWGVVHLCKAHTHHLWRVVHIICGDMCTLNGTACLCFLSGTCRVLEVHVNKLWGAASDMSMGFMGGLLKWVCEPFSRICGQYFSNHVVVTLSLFPAPSFSQTIQACQS